MFSIITLKLKNYTIQYIIHKIFYFQKQYKVVKSTGVERYTIIVLSMAVWGIINYNFIFLLNE